MTDTKTIKWLYRKIKKQVPAMVVLSAANALYALLAVVFALLSKGLIDSAAAKDAHSAFVYGVYFALLICIQLLLRSVCRILEERTRARVDMALKHSLFKSVMKKDYMAVSKLHSGDILNRMFGDIQVISDGISSLLPTVVSLVTKLIGAFAVLMSLDMRFSLIFILAGGVMFLVTAVFRTKMKSLHRDVRETDGHVREYMQEAVENILPVKVFGREDRTVRVSDTFLKKNYRAVIKRAFVHTAANIGFLAVFRLGYLYAIAYGAYGMIVGSISYGSVMAIIQLVGQVQLPFANLSGIVPKYYSVISSAERAAEIENLPDDKYEIKSREYLLNIYEKAEALRIENVTFSYGGETVLDGACAEIKKGEFIAVTGRSGIGKSTLLKLILGMYRAGSGRICISGGGTDYVSDGSLRKMFAYVPQGNFLFSGTIYDNITFACDGVGDDDIKRALYISCADTFVNELPDGVFTEIGERGAGLSEGQVQRLAIARAVLTGAKILLLDEATSALDEATEERLLKNLKLISGITCIIVSHKRAAYEICDRIIEIENKKIKKILKNI